MEKAEIKAQADKIVTIGELPKNSILHIIASKIIKAKGYYTFRYAETGEKIFVE